MSKQTKLWLIVAASLVLLGGIVFTVAMSEYHWDFSKLSTENYETHTYTISDEFSGISIHTNTADIIFAPSDNANSKVVCYESDKEYHSVFVKDGILVIQIIDGREWYEHIGINFDSPKITVYLPNSNYGSLLVKASTGNIVIPNNFNFVNADISLSTGDVQFSASTSDLAKVKTTTGDIKVENITVGMLDLSVSTGDVVVSGVACEGDIQINTTTGKTTLTDTKCKNLISAGTTGSILLKDTVATDMFSIGRDTGDVRFERADAAKIFVETDTGDVKGTFLTEKVFVATTDTGHVDVPTTATGGRCEITTDTGDIVLTIEN